MTAAEEKTEIYAVKIGAVWARIEHDPFDRVLYCGEIILERVAEIDADAIEEIARALEGGAKGETYATEAGLREWDDATRRRDLDR